MDALAAYCEQEAENLKIARLLGSEKILFCCYSRLLAILWTHAEQRQHHSSQPITNYLAGSCTTYAEGLEIYAANQPSLIISTQLLEAGSGIDLIRDIKRQDPHRPTVLFLQHQNIPIFQQAVNCNSDGIVLESEMGTDHINIAIRTVLKGGSYIEPAIAEALAGSQERRNPGLTERELDVMKHVVFGLNDREIGQKLFIATDTVKYHLKQIYARLGIHNRTRAAISLVMMGLVDPPSPLIPEKK